MKYCSNCGSSIDEETIFCSNCGVKLELGIKNQEDNKLSFINNYNLILYKDSCSWQYVKDNFDKVIKLIEKQNSLANEFKELLKSLLVKENDKLSSEEIKQVYMYILKMLKQMCEESEKMFSDYSGYKELFETNKSVLMANKFLNFIMEMDNNYKIILGCQVCIVSDIKSILNEEIIKKDRDLRNLTFQLAEAFNNMWYSCIKRYTDFFLSPSQDFIDLNWSFYINCIKGLYQFEIDKLDENGWNIAINDQVKNHNEIKYRDNFNNNRLKLKEEQIERDKEDKKKFYFESHPEKYEYYKENYLRYESLKKSEIDSVNIISEINEKFENLNKKIIELKLKIENKSNDILHLKKSIFGQKATQNKKERLNNELIDYKEQLEKFEKEISELEKNKERENSNLINIRKEKENFEKDFQKFNFDEVIM